MYMYMGHSVLSFALLENGMPHYPLFSLLHQKIDRFLKKTVKFFGQPPPERSFFNCQSFITIRFVIADFK